MSGLSTAYAESFEQLARQLPEPEGQRRREQLAGFLAAGFPGPASEDWHYTDLAPLATQAFAVAARTDDATLPAALGDGYRLVYVNGHCSARHSTAAALDGRWAAADATLDEPFDGLNAAFALNGLQLRLGAGEHPKRPLAVQIQTDSDAQPTMVHQRHRIELGAHAEATVLLQFSGRGGERLSTHHVEVRLGAGARLNLHRLCEESEGSTLVTRIEARIGRDAGLRLSGTDIGGGLARHVANLVLAEPGAEVEANALYLPRAGARLDNRFQIVHAAPHCRSRLNGRGIIDERAKASFNGKVVVRPGAQKTDSEQRIANLLLSRKAEINAKPDLEIYADDVKCAHGSTVGQLDEVALAYLRSRGIPRDTARALLLRAFATEILDRIEWPALREYIEAALHLPSEMPLELEAGAEA